MFLCGFVCFVLLTEVQSERAPTLICGHSCTALHSLQRGCVCVADLLSGAHLYGSLRLAYRTAADFDMPLQNLSKVVQAIDVSTATSHGAPHGTLHVLCMTFRSHPALLWLGCRDATKVSSMVS